jgi:hypothetical protein
LLNPGSNYYYNARGLKEKYLQGAGDQWYYLLQTGDFYHWGGSVAASTLVANVGVACWTDPSQLWNAPAPTDAAAAYSLRQTYGLTNPGNGYYQNTRGLNEKYLVGTGNQWFYLLPTGDLYRWGGTLAASTLVGNAGVASWYDPSLLWNATPPPLLTAAVSLSGNQLTVNANSFVGTFQVAIEVRDGAVTMTRTFLVTVTP